MAVKIWDVTVLFLVVLGTTVKGKNLDRKKLTIAKFIDVVGEKRVRIKRLNKT